MLCEKCGNQVSEFDTNCRKCGAPLPQNNTEAQTADHPIETQQNSDDLYIDYNSQTVPIACGNTLPPEPPRKNTAKIAVIIASIVAVLSAIITVIVLSISTEPATNESKEDLSCLEEVKGYLDYIANKEKDVQGYISDLYYAGDFGQYYSGDDAAEMHEIISKAIFNEKKKLSDMGKFYPDTFDYDTWENYIKEGSIDKFYFDMLRSYGKWQMGYEITDTRKMTSDETKKLNGTWNEVVENYEELLNKRLKLEKDDSKKLKEFVNTIKELKPSEAYEIAVTLDITGKKDSSKKDVEFTVAKVGEEWVILEGPSLYKIS